MNGMRFTIGGRTTGLLALFSALTLCLAFAGTATAAPPANDDFADAVVFNQNTANGSGTTIDATAETSEQLDPGLSETFSVWYRATAPEDGTMILDTCPASGSSASQPRVAVYTGTTIGNLTLQGNGSCRIATGVEAEVTYHFSVNPQSAEERAAFDYTYRFLPPPANDDFADAVVLQGARDGANPAHNFGATLEAGEPPHGSGVSGTSAWYEWTAPATGGVTVDACNSDNYYVTVVAAYTGDAVDNLTSLNDGQETCRVRIETTAGTTYRFAVDGHFYAGGQFELRLNSAARPANDDFADAQDITGTNIQLAGNTLGASVEDGEPTPDADASVWFRWTAPADGAIRLKDPCRLMTTRFAVFTGTALGDLDLVKNGECGIGFAAEAGVTYSIAVSSAKLYGFGEFQARLRSFPVLDNDDFADARALTGETVDEAAHNVVATREPDDPHADGENSVWFKWTAPATQEYTIDTCGSQMDTVLGVYTGDDLANLTLVGENDDSYGWPGNGCGSRSAVIAELTEGTEYKIVVDGYYQEEIGDLRLRIYPGALVPLRYTVTMDHAGTGAGTARAYTPDDLIACSGDCDFEINDAGSFDLEAEPDEGSEFAGWSIDGQPVEECPGPQCELYDATSDLTVTATFNSIVEPEPNPGTRRLTVNFTGNGTGRIGSLPPGINCQWHQTDCEAIFPTGTQVVLVPTPFTGSSFAGWTGACAGVKGACTVDLGSDQAVGVNFALDAVNPGDPPNAFTLKTGRVKLNRKAGTAKVPVTVSAAAKITLKGRGVKPRKASTRGAKTVRLSVVARGKIKRKLKRSGRAKVKLIVRAKPASGGPAVKKKLTVKLKQKKRKRAR
jgi:hypothetical protein